MILVMILMLILVMVMIMVMIFVLMLILMMLLTGELILMMQVLTRTSPITKPSRDSCWERNEL